MPAMSLMMEDYDGDRLLSISVHIEPSGKEMVMGTVKLSEFIDEEGFNELKQEGDGNALDDSISEGVTDWGCENTGFSYRILPKTE